MYITKNGAVKNYLNHKKEFGNVKNQKIKDIVNTDKFRQLWEISNDKIEKCKDCQFRYCCESNSDIIYKNKLLFKTNLCLFDPYINEWEN